MEGTDSCPDCLCSNVKCVFIGTQRNDVIREMFCNHCSTEWCLRYENPQIEDIKTYDQ